MGARGLSPGAGGLWCIGLTGGLFNWQGGCSILAEVHSAGGGETQERWRINLTWVSVVLCSLEMIECWGGYSFLCGGVGWASPGPVGLSGAAAIGPGLDGPGLPCLGGY